ncbi:hypothetical protein SNEBB_008640, partial [Seison nebaliae]
MNPEKKARKEIRQVDDDNALPQEEAVMVEGGKRKIIPDDEVTNHIPTPTLVAMARHLQKMVKENTPKYYEEQDVVEGHDPKGNGPNLDPTDLPEYQSEDEFDFDGEKLPEEQDVVEEHDSEDEADQLYSDFLKKVVAYEELLFLPRGKKISHKVFKKRKGLKAHHECVNSVAQVKLCPVCEQYHLPIHQCWQAYNRKLIRFQMQNPNYVELEYNRKEEFFAEQLAIYMEEDQHLNRVLQEVANIGEEKVIRPINDPR